jgi:long-chain acyl-CoA synthetase
MQHDSKYDADAVCIAPAAAPAKAEQVFAELPDRISLVIRRWAKERPQHVALIAGSISWTYRQFARIVDEVAGEFKAYGVRAGDRVMIVSENSLPLVAMIMAASENDAWAVVANPRLSDREIDQIREHSGARRVFYVGDGAAQAHAVRHGATMERMRPLGSLRVGPLNSATVPEAIEVQGSLQVAALMYTSGTTGRPKAVMLTHQNILYAASEFGRRYETSPADRVYCVLPMSHIVGLSLVLITSLMFGATLQIVSQYDPAALVTSIAKDGITSLFGVPAIFQRLLEYRATNGISTMPRGNLRVLLVAGAALSPSLKRRVETEWGVPLLNAYGLTETAPSIASVPLDSPCTDDRVGQPMPGVEWRLVDRDGHPVMGSEIGELHVRSPGVMLGYYRALELTQAVIDPDGWFNTGDLARMTDGNLYIAGRTKELIIRSGFNVYPTEVEAVLDSHEDVVRSAVIGRSVDGNEEVIAFVQLLPGSRTDATTLAAYARDQLTAYKRPREIVILDRLPLAPTGKILKNKLPLHQSQTCSDRRLDSAETRPDVQS